MFLFSQALNNMMQNRYDMLVSFDIDVAERRLFLLMRKPESEVLSIQAIIKHLVCEENEPKKEGGRRSIIDLAHQLGYFGEF